MKGMHIYINSELNFIVPVQLLMSFMTVGYSVSNGEAVKRTAGIGPQNLGRVVSYSPILCRVHLFSPSKPQS
jgi:hypothetical protein